MQSARLDASQDGVKIAQRNINNLRYADDTTLMAESKEELKSLLMRTKEDSDKTGLKNFFFFNIQQTKIVASGPITSWQMDGEKVETRADFIFLCSKITADGDWEPEEPTVSICGCWVRLLRVLWTARKSNQSILKEINSEINKTMQMTTPLWQKAKKNWRAAWWKWKRRVKKLA